MLPAASPACYVSALFPALKTKFTTPDQILELCHQKLGFKKTDMELFRLIPCMEESPSEGSDQGKDVVQDFVSPALEISEPEFALRIHNSSVSIRAVETIIQQRDKFKEQLQKTNEALITYLKELQKMRKYFMDLVSENTCGEEGKTSEQDQAKKAIRYKKLEVLHAVLAFASNSTTTKITCIGGQQTIKAAPEDTAGKFREPKTGNTKHSRNLKRRV